MSAEAEVSTAFNLSFAPDDAAMSPLHAADRRSDGPCLLLHLVDLVAAAQRAKVIPPVIRKIGVKSRLDAISLRLQVQLSAAHRSPEAVLAAVLLNEPLRKQIERECRERQLAGRPVTGSQKGSKWETFGKIARLSASSAYRLAVLLASKNKEDHLRRILLPKSHRQHATIAQLYREEKAADQIVKRVATISRPLPPVKPGAIVDQVINKSAIDGLHDLSPNSVGLYVTSPPYPHPRTYAKFGMVWEGYDKWLSERSEELRLMLEKADAGAHLCVNIDEVYVAAQDKDAKGAYHPRRNCTYDLYRLAVDAGWVYTSTILWWKQNAVSKYPMLGSFDSPLVIPSFESILVFRKAGERTNSTMQRTVSDADLSKWLTGGVWDFFPESRKTGPCPYPFPEELPRRCIELFSFVGDLVCDPFAGNGTTLRVARKLNRQWVGIESHEVTAKYAQGNATDCEPGDPIAPSPSVIDTLASAAASRMLMCPALVERSRKHSVGSSATVSREAELEGDSDGPWRGLQADHDRRRSRQGFPPR